MNGAMNRSNQLFTIGGLEIVFKLELLAGLMACNGQQNRFLISAKFSSGNFHIITLTMPL